MPKPHRTAGTGQLRAHSRNSSAAKLGVNLQLTQKDAQPRKGYGHGAHPYNHDLNHNTKAPSIPRTNSAIRAVPSKDQVPHPPPNQPKRNTSEQTQHKVHAPNYRPNGKLKAGFTIASPADEDDDDDEDAWISTESGAVTPSGHESESDDSEAGTRALTPIDKPKVVRLVTDTFDKPKPPLTLQLDDNGPHNRGSQLLTSDFYDASANDDSRIDRSDTKTALPLLATARPRDYAEPVHTAPPVSDPSHQAVLSSDANPPRTQSQTPTPVQPSTAPTSPIQSAPPSRPSSKRWSRPPSMLSTLSKQEHHSQALRPHPLIRGNSYGQPNHPIAKPAPLAPLTVISEPSPSPTPAPSKSTTSPFQEDRLSTSPTSMKTDTASPSSPRPPHPYRRTSVSSTRSVATLPAPTASATFSQPWTPLTHSRSSDRPRTLSTLSTSSSSAAISSLAHLPAVTRPPTPQTVAFFPPVNPYADPDKMHPLLPRPYLLAHMTVLAKRHPLRESYDRVMAVKHGK